jgi:predicted nucleotidyltransferase
LSDLANPNKRKELQEAERLAILNQLLMVVRNMVIFDFTEKEVKAFASRFIKLLRQD